MPRNHPLANEHPSSLNTKYKLLLKYILSSENLISNISYKQAHKQFNVKVPMLKKIVCSSDFVTGYKRSKGNPY